MKTYRIAILAAALLAACDRTPTAASGTNVRCEPRVYETPTGPIVIPGDSTCLGREH